MATKTAPTTENSVGPGDAIVAVMGITGSGKSSFIDLLVDEDVGIGHDLTSCTTQVQTYGFVREDRRKVILLDTPGFDDTDRTDIEVLKDIAFFLSQMYRNAVQLTGIVYLHKITDNRMSGSVIRNLRMFKQLCGEDVYPRIVLATTMWSYLEGSQATLDQGAKHVEELKARKDWWGLMHDRGSKVVRHGGDRDSALNIVNGLVESRDAKPALAIQTELVQQKLSLNDTSAGREVEKDIHEAQDKMQKRIEGLKEEYKAALKDRDGEHAMILEKERVELRGKIEKAAKDQQALKIDLERLLEEKSAEYKQLQDQLLEEQRKHEEMTAKYEQQQAEVQAERRRDAEAFNEQRAETERQLRLTESRIQEMYKKDQKETATRLEADQARHEERMRDLDERFKKHEADLQRREQELATKIKQTKKLSKSRFVMPIVGMLASLGTVIAGVVTLQPGLVTAGFSGMGSSWPSQDDGQNGADAGAEPPE